MADLTPKQRFAKYFPDRVEKLVKTLDLLENCANTHNYERNDAIVHDCFVELAKYFRATASAFEIDWEVTVEGTPVELLPPKHKRKKSDA